MAWFFYPNVAHASRKHRRIVTLLLSLQSLFSSLMCRTVTADKKNSPHFVAVDNISTFHAPLWLQAVWQSGTTSDAGRGPKSARSSTCPALRFSDISPAIKVGFSARLDLGTPRFSFSSHRQSGRGRIFRCTAACVSVLCVIYDTNASWSQSD